MSETTFENIIRVGKISSVSGNTARVIFPSLGNMVSGDLRILQRPVTVEEHGVANWYPTIGQTVLCVYVALEDADGFILGGL